MTEFWETSFQAKKAMWGDLPAESAILASKLFSERGYRHVLIPGIGYGRNASPFLDAGMNVTGIEISETAVAMAKAGLGAGLIIHYGSVAGMPFDDTQYDAVFSFALIHLLDQAERAKFIASCFAQLRPGGTMIFTTIAETAPMFGRGIKISERLYETMPGVRLFFYDAQSITQEFGRKGLERFYPISEPAKHMPDSSNLDFLWIQCLKNDM